MLGLLNILEPFNITTMTFLNTHRLIEAMKFAFGARSEITDPKFVENTNRFDEFYTKTWADEIRPKISAVSARTTIHRTILMLIMQNETHGVDYYGLLHDVPADHGTTHLSLVDKWGGAVSITSTVGVAHLDRLV